MWQRINRPSQLLVSNDQTAAKATTASFGMESSSSLSSTQGPAGFQFTPIEISSIQPAQGIPIPAPTLNAESDLSIATLSDEEVAVYLRKIRNFDAVLASDIFLDARYETTLLKTTHHLSRVEAFVGHGFQFNELR